MQRFARLVRLVLIAGSAGLLATAAQAIPFILDGNAGLGLLRGNENPPVVTGGSGGILTGIDFDTTTNILTIDIGWGSGNGFTDLSGLALIAHIHGPTPNPAPAGFSENTGTLYDLHLMVGWNPSPSSGGFDGTVAITPGAHVAALLNNQLYINVHTFQNPNGEIRGHLVAVPEPSTLGLLALGLVLVTVRRRRA
jgi:CHRD domain-containing protein/PEP-CTERM motif-containing protein